MVLVIWDYNDKVYSKMFKLEDIMHKKELKLNGRKPNKLIIPENLYTDKTKNKLKKLCAYTAKIVTIKDKHDIQRT